MRRNAIEFGAIEMLRSIPIVGMQSLFLSNGLGIGSYTGWALADGRNNTLDMRSYFPVGRDERTTDPNNGIWDPNYNNVGNTGGIKDQDLGADENYIPGTVANGEYGKVRATEENKTDNRPPYKVLIFIQKIT